MFKNYFTIAVRTLIKNKVFTAIIILGLAIFISCLGLLGLVIYTTSQRTKEIGVRKVLGATVSQIVTMISKDFIILVLVAFVIAIPFALIVMQKMAGKFCVQN